MRIKPPFLVDWSASSEKNEWNRQYQERTVLETTFYLFSGRTLGVVVQQVRQYRSVSETEMWFFQKLYILDGVWGPPFSSFLGIKASDFMQRGAGIFE